MPGSPRTPPPATGRQRKQAITSPDYVWSASPPSPSNGGTKVDKRSGLLPSLDLSHLTANEQQHIQGVLRQFEEAERKVHDHCSFLKEQQQSMIQKSSVADQSVCSLCHRELAFARSQVCTACNLTVCYQCSSLLRHGNGGQSHYELTCKLCCLRRQVFLASNDWRSSVDKFFVEDKIMTHGCGMILVCGFKSDGGVLRTFVLKAPAGGSASEGGVLEGDEVVAWCDTSLIGLSYWDASDVIRKYCQGSIAVAVRRNVRGQDEQHVCLVHQQAQGSVEPNIFVQKVLVDPAAVGYPEGIFQASTGNGSPMYVHGRIQLRLSIGTQYLLVVVMEAERLPQLKPGVANSPSVSVTLNRRSTFSTVKCPRHKKPVWNEALSFDTPKSISESTLKISVKTPKQLFGKAAIGERLINLGECLLNNTPQWYTLLGPNAPHGSADPSRPSEPTRGDMVRAHLQRLQERQQLGGSQPNLTLLASGCSER